MKRTARLQRLQAPSKTTAGFTCFYARTSGGGGARGTCETRRHRWLTRARKPWHCYVARCGAARANPSRTTGLRQGQTGGEQVVKSRFPATRALWDNRTKQSLMRSVGIRCEERSRNEIPRPSAAGGLMFPSHPRDSAGLLASRPPGLVRNPATFESLIHTGRTARGSLPQWEWSASHGP